MAKKIGEFREIYTNTYGRDTFERLIQNFFGQRVDLRGFSFRDAEEGVDTEHKSDNSFVSVSQSPCFLFVLCDIREKELDKGYFFTASLEGEDFVGAMLEAEERYKREGCRVCLDFVDYDNRIAGFVWRVQNV
ncbi:MAG: hypothetical protein AABX86_02980 [Nanoarchaeota archaeon]